MYRPLRMFCLAVPATLLAAGASAERVFTDETIPRDWSGNVETQRSYSSDGGVRAEGWRPVAETDAADDVAFSDARLEQMLAPIALYPDALLAQILVAATYPLEVVEAARWSRQNPELEGEVAVEAVADRGWDPSVQSLVAFPDVLAQLDRDLDWMQHLGEAMLYQEGDVMASVQRLREQARGAGTLDRMEYAEVIREQETIIIEPVRERVVYVPYYDTRVVYGSWRHAHYQPVYWHPPRHYRPASSFFYWGHGIPVSSGFYFSTFHWPRHHLMVLPRHRPHVHLHFHSQRPRKHIHVHGHRWRHDPVHRRGVQYRHRGVQARYGGHDRRAASYREYRQRDRNRHRHSGDDRQRRSGGDRRDRSRDAGTPTTRIAGSTRAQDRHWRGVRERTRAGAERTRASEQRGDHPHSGGRADREQRRGEPTSRIAGRPRQDRTRDPGHDVANRQRSSAATTSRPSVSTGAATRAQQRSTQQRSTQQRSTQQRSTQQRSAQPRSAQRRTSTQRQRSTAAQGATPQRSGNQRPTSRPGHTQRMSRPSGERTRASGRSERSGETSRNSRSSGGDGNRGGRNNSRLGEPRP